MQLYHSFIQLVRDSLKWRLQPGWFTDPTFIDFLDKQIDMYFVCNTSQTSASIRWEAFKAFIRGQIITISKKEYTTGNEDIR